MSELKVSLRRIAEDGFTLNEAIVADAAKPVIPQIGFDLLSDIEKNLLTIAMQVIYATPEKEVAAALRFRYTLEVNSLKNLQYVVDAKKGTHNYRFPNGFLEAVLADAYATARVLMASHLSGTRLETVYLPFGGAANLVKILNKR